MERRDFLKTVAGGAFATVLMPGLLPQFMIRQYAAMPSLGWEPKESVRITVVGVGLFGAKTAQLLSRNAKNITCHEVVFNQQEQDTNRLEELFDSVRHSDLLFVVSGFDDRFCELFVTAITETARSAGVLTVAVVPQANQGLVPYRSFAQLTGPLFVLSDLSIPNPSGAAMQGAQPIAGLSGYALRHLIATISGLSTERSFICIDFADISAILYSGGRGWLGVGDASGEGKGRVATLHAIERLTAQGVRAADCKGAVVCLYASSLVAMDDYDQANCELHRYFQEDTNVIFGCLIDEQMGGNLRITAMAIT